MSKEKFIVKLLALPLFILVGFLNGLLVIISGPRAAARALRATADNLDEYTW